MSRYLVIVSRQASDLAAYREQFADDPSVTVLQDRRQGDRRTGTDRRAGRPTLTSAAAERRRSERRRQPDIDKQIAELGFAVIHVED